MYDIELTPILHILDAPTTNRIIDFSNTKVVRLQTYIYVTCPSCSQSRYILKAKLGNPTKTTFCKKCALVPRINWYKQEELDLRNDVVVDLNDQVLMHMSSDAKYKHGTFIMTTCPRCNEKRYMRLCSIRAGHSTFCRKCTKTNVKEKNRFIKEKTLKGDGTYLANKYRYIHELIIIERYGKEFLDELIKYIKPHRNGKYFAEHRVVAFRKFGNTVSWDNTVVRHIDGNKINNSSDNIIIGSIGDNNLDHCTARKEMMMWKSIALEFINRYFILNKEINDNK